MPNKSNFTENCIMQDVYQQECGLFKVVKHQDNGIMKSRGGLRKSKQSDLKMKDEKMALNEEDASSSLVV